MFRARSITLVLVLCSFAIAACSIVYGGDLNDARDIDAINSNNRPDANVSDGSTDVPIVIPTDPDAGADGQAPLIRGCAGHIPAPIFCEDFDDPAKPLDQGWTRVANQNGTIGFDTTQFFSGSRSGRAAMNTQEGCFYLRFERNISAASATQYALASARFRPEPWKGTRTPFVFHLIRDDLDLSCSLIMYIEGDESGKMVKAGINGQGAAGMFNDGRPLQGLTKENEWTLMQIRVTPAPMIGPGSNVEVTLTGEDGIANVTNHYFEHCRLGGRISVGAGYHCGDEAAVANYDDVILDFK